MQWYGKIFFVIIALMSGVEGRGDCSAWEEDLSAVYNRKMTGFDYL